MKLLFNNESRVSAWLLRVVILAEEVDLDRFDLKVLMFRVLDVACLVLLSPIHQNRLDRGDNSFSDSKAKH